MQRFSVLTSLHAKHVSGSKSSRGPDPEEDRGTAHPVALIGVCVVFTISNTRRSKPQASVRVGGRAGNDARRQVRHAHHGRLRAHRGEVAVPSSGLSRPVSRNAKAGERKDRHDQQAPRQRRSLERCPPLPFQAAPLQRAPRSLRRA